MVIIATKIAKEQFSRFTRDNQAKFHNFENPI